MRNILLYFRRRPQQSIQRLITESIALPDAYACLNCIQVVEGLTEQKTCKLCGSWQVLSVMDSLKWLERELAIKREKKTEKKTPTSEEARRAMNENLSLHLTSPNSRLTRSL